MAVAVAALLVLVGTVAVVAFFASPGPTEPHCGAPRKLTGPLAEVDTCDEAAVITAALSVMFSWDPSKDPSPAAAVERARPLITDQLWSASQEPATNPLTSAPYPAAPQASEWEDWARNHQRVVAAPEVVKRLPRLEEIVVHRSLVSDSGSSRELQPFTLTYAWGEIANDGWRFAGVTAPANTSTESTR